MGLAFGALAQAAVAEDMNTFDLVKAGDKYVGVQAQDKVVQIHSDKSVAGLMPSIWYVDYYDPTATLKATEVKFGGGQMMDVKRPMHLLAPVTGGTGEMDMHKVHIEAERALAIARKQPLLDRLDLRASQFWLENVDAQPAWKVKLWAAKLNNPDHMADIGELLISADTGEVLRNDLHINSVD
jgi:hypothetical protein